MVNTTELNRLSAVRKLEILDSENEKDFDDLVSLAVLVFEVPISTVTIMDSYRQWFKASVGLNVKETSRDISFCNHAIQQFEPMIVPDASLDSRFVNNPLVTGEPHLAFYAGVPLLNSDNLAIGTFCIMDSKPKHLTAKQIDILNAIANQVVKLLELRAERNKYRDLVLEKDIVNKELAEIKQRWQFAIEGSGDGVWDWNIQTNKTFFSKRWKSMLGYEVDDIPNTYQAFASLIHKDDIPNITKKLNDYLAGKTSEFKSEIRLLCKDNSYKWILSRGMVVEFDPGGLPKRMAGTHTDISSRKQTEEVIWRQANFDLLTGLPNRRMFFDRLKEEIKKATRARSKFALMFIDLDGFKEVNDKYGHKTGDNLLIQVVKRVSQCIRACDTFSRLGGDEFTIILTELNSVEDIDFVATKVLGVINQPFQLGVNKVMISASIGVSIFPEHTKESDALISLADAAMYTAKTQGKNRWIIAS
ncbi:MAG: diguanylate cyclase [Methylophilus sp.]|nr:diguanylate cyclase [Methylophilus sp.]